MSQPTNDPFTASHVAPGVSTPGSVEPLPPTTDQLPPLPKPGEQVAASHQQPDSKQVAKDEALAVADSAKAEGKHVADEAKAQGQEVVQEARRQVNSLVGQAQGVLTDQASTQKDRAAGGVRTLSEDFAALASGNAQSGVAADLAHAAGQKLDQVAGWLENRDHNQVISDVQRYARRNPGTFLLLAAGAGLVAGRLTRSLKDSSSDPSPSRESTPHLAQRSTAYVAPSESTLAPPAGQPLTPAPEVNRDHA